MDEQMEGGREEWMEERKEGWMDEQMDGWMSNREERKKGREEVLLLPGKKKNQWGQHGDSYLTKAFI